MTTTRAVTQISKGTCQTLRPKMADALNKVLADYGMKAAIGNITFSPIDLRFKVNIVLVDPNSTTTKEVKVGQTWQFGNKTYRIEQINGTTIHASRPSRGKYALMFGNGRQTYRMDRSRLLAGGTLVKDV
jgi:hypothetical protein